VILLNKKNAVDELDYTLSHSRTWFLWGASCCVRIVNWLKQYMFFTCFATIIVYCLNQFTITFQKTIFFYDEEYLLPETCCTISLVRKTSMKYYTHYKILYFHFVSWFISCKLIRIFKLQVWTFPNFCPVYTGISISEFTLIPVMTRPKVSYCQVSHGSSVGIATGYELDKRGRSSRHEG
jgi:hypothetical protein